VVDQNVSLNITLKRKLSFTIVTGIQSLDSSHLAATLYLLNTWGTDNTALIAGFWLGDKGNYAGLGLFKGNLLNQIKGQINYLGSNLNQIKGQIKHYEHISSPAVPPSLLT
jgi:hypothetical protein